MIADAIITELKTYASVLGYVSRYTVTGNPTSIPAVFSGKAPDKTSYPYIIVRVNGDAGGVRIIDSFNVYIDFYEENSSDANQITVAKNVLNTLDCKSLSNADYSNIRFFRSSFGPVEVSRVNFKHYNLQFTCRATRKSWIQSKT